MRSLLCDKLTQGELIPTVCIDCRYVGVRPSGIGEVVQGLVDHAPRIAPDLRFVLLKSPERQEPLSTCDNVTEHVVRSKANSAATMWLLPQITPFGDIDLFHGTYNTMPARLSVPVVTTVHDIMWLTHPHWCDGSPGGLVKRQFFGHGIRRALSRSAEVAAISTATRDAILNLYPDLADRISVTLSGVSERFRPRPREESLLNSVGIRTGARFALTVGQNAPYKNHERAIRAFSSAFAEEDGVELVLVHRRGPSVAPLRRLAKKLGIADRVHFAGTVDEPVLLQLYSSASALLHPSLCEGFGNPVAESMACGTPVITSNRSAMPEVAGGAARLVDPMDEAQIAGALREVVFDETVAQQLRDAGVARAGEFRWEDFARANVDIYRKVLGD